MDSLTINRTSSCSNYNAIDVMKFIMSICVVAIHTEPLNNCDSKVIIQLYNCFIKHAVPFFYISAGFFLGRKLTMANSGDRFSNLTPLVQYLKRIVQMYVLWTIVYLPLTIVGFIKWNDTIVTALLRFVRNLFFWGENYNSWQLWYLLSAIYAFLFVFVLLKKGISIRIISVLGLLIVIANLFLYKITGYDGAVSVILIAKRIINVTIVNGQIFRGFFYVPLGIFMATKQVLPYKIGVLLFPIGFLLRCFTKGIIPEFALIISSIGLFLIIVNVKLPDSMLYQKLRHMSTDVYLIHMMIWTAYYVLIYGEQTTGFDSFIFTTIISIVCSIGLSYLREKKLRI